MLIVYRLIAALLALLVLVVTLRERTSLGTRGRRRHGPRPARPPPAAREVSLRMRCHRLPSLVALAALGLAAPACRAASPARPRARRRDAGPPPARHAGDPRHPARARESPARLMLSHYHPSLAGTPGDTPVFVLEGKEPGGTLVVVGGTHENEIAGVFAATVLVETARVNRGRLVVVPRANNSAVTLRDEKRPAPEWVVITLALRLVPASRRFRFGSRLTNPLHQGAPDPAELKLPGASKALPGYEARNLDRAYPGSADGPAHPAGRLRDRRAPAPREGRPGVRPPRGAARVPALLDARLPPPGARAGGDGRPRPGRGGPPR